jgi:hypothetical protein
MSKAKRKLTKFDFSGEGAHVALVHQDQGGAANEYKTLITKAKDVTIELSMEEFLRRFFGLWWDDAEFLAKLLGYETEMDSKEPYEWKHELEDKVALMKSAKEDFKALDDDAKANVADIVKKLSEFSNVTITDITKYTKGGSPLSDNSKNPEEVNKQMSEEVIKAADVQAMIAKALADEKAKWEAEKAEEIEKAATQISELEKSLNAYKEAEAEAKKASFVAKAKEFEVLGVEGEAVECVAKALMSASENEDMKALVELVEKAVQVVKGLEGSEPVGSDAQPEENVAEESGVMAAIKAKKTKV